MKIRYAILVALVALLQGLAPLLHAHMGGDHSDTSGVHLHGGLHAPAGDSIDRFTDAGPLESQAVGLGQEIRRDQLWQPMDVAHAELPVWNDASRTAQVTSCAAADVTPARVSHHLLPPAQAPPHATA